MPQNTNTHLRIMLSCLTPKAKRVLLAIKNKVPLADVADGELIELFTKGVLRQDYDLLGKKDVVLLTALGKRLLELLDSDPPPDPPRPRMVFPSHGKLVHPKRRKAA